MSNTVASGCLRAAGRPAWLPPSVPGKTRLHQRTTRGTREHHESTTKELVAISWPPERFLALLHKRSRKLGHTEQAVESGFANSASLTLLLARAGRAQVQA
jgi:hypothetical protein